MDKIKRLAETQKALKEQKRKTQVEMKNALKRKKRLQGKASLLSDKDLLEVLCMRKAKKDAAQADATMEPAQEAPPPEPETPA